MDKMEEVPEQIISGCVLADCEIKRRLHHDLFIHPMIDEDTQIFGCRVDLHLGTKFYEVKHSTLEVYDTLSLEKRDYIRTLILNPGDSYILHPREFVMVPAFENISIPSDLLGILQGRSSLSRLGIIVHATAGFVDPNYKGCIVLELSNLGHLPVKITPLLKVASIAFVKIGGIIEKLYSTKYTRDIFSEEIKLGKHDSLSFIPSRLNEDWESRVLSHVKQANHQ